MDADVRSWQLDRLRQQAASLREDATYWRRRGQVDTAAELERVAALVDELIRGAERMLGLGKRA